MSFNQLNRRLHLYLALVLLPWFVMYAVSALPFAHRSLFLPPGQDAKPTFTTRFSGPYEIPAVPEDVQQLRPVGQKIAADLGLSGRLFHISRPDPDTLNMYLYDFWHATQVSYSIPQRQLVAKDREFRWDMFLTGLHARGGFNQESLLSDMWGVVIDIVCVAIFLWILTGLYMWWLLKRTRLWGSLAIVTGIVLAAVFVIRL